MRGAADWDIGTLYIYFLLLLLLVLFFFLFLLIGPNSASLQSEQQGGARKNCWSGECWLGSLVDLVGLSV